MNVVADEFMVISAEGKGMPGQIGAILDLFGVAVMREGAGVVASVELFLHFFIGHLEVAVIPVLHTEVPVVLLFEVGVVSGGGVHDWFELCLLLLVHLLTAQLSSLALFEMVMAPPFPFAALCASGGVRPVSHFEHELANLRFPHIPQI